MRDPSSARPAAPDDDWLEFYSQAATASTYQAASALQPPEQAIVDLLSPALPRARVLDVGVGGGRTAAHLARR